MISDNVDSINQQVLNKAMLDPTRNNVRIIVMKSKTELIPPKNLAKLLIRLIFQFLGLIQLFFIDLIR